MVNGMPYNRVYELIRDYYIDKFGRESDRQLREDLEDIGFGIKLLYEREMTDIAMILFDFDDNDLLTTADITRVQKDLGLIPWTNYQSQSEDDEALEDTSTAD